MRSLVFLVCACASAPDTVPPVTKAADCPPGATRRERDVADPNADDQVIRHEIACVLPDGTFHGAYELRFGDAITARGTYDHGKRTGRWIEGTREGDYVDDKEDGEWRSFHAPGKLAWRGTFKHGKRHGRFEWFLPDGSRQQAGELVDDLQDGTWTFYRPDGSIERTEIWSRGTRK